MKIEEGIKALLREKGVAVVPDLGTFRISHVGASVQEQGGVIAPPAEIIEFSEETNSAGANSIADYLHQSGYSAEQSEEAVGNFVDSVRSHTSSGAKSTVEGIGFFRANEAGDIEFFSEEEMRVTSESFGLPKLKARPLVPVVVNPTPPKPVNSKLLLKAILVPLVLIALILIFLVFKPDAYNSLASYFSGSGNDTELIDDKKGEEVVENEIAPIKKGEEDTNKDGNEIAKEDRVKEEDANNEKADESDNDDRGATTGGVISSKTNRFYIIIGSFTNDSAARKPLPKRIKLAILVRKS